MHRLIFFCFVLFQLFAAHSSAQDAKGNCDEHLFLPQKSTIAATVAHSISRPTTLVKSDYATVGLFGISETVQQNERFNVENGVHYKAFFCKMETMLHSHLNIWIKLRAGDDASYRQMISAR